MEFQQQTIKKNMCQRFFSNFDVLGEQNLLRYNRKSSYRTCLGGCFSLAMLILFVAIIAYKVLKAIFSTDLAIGSYQLQEADPGEIKLSNKNFMMALQVDEADFITQPYFSFMLAQKNINENNVVSTAWLSLEPCTRSHFQGAEDQFDKLHLSNFLCISKDYVAYLRGQLGSKLQQYLELQVVDCLPLQYGSWPNSCKSIADRSAYLATQQGFKLKVYFTGYTPQQDWDDKVKRYIDTQTSFTFNPSTSFKSYQYNVKNFKVSLQSPVYPVLDYLVGENTFEFPHLTNEQLYMDSRTPALGQTIYSEIVLQRSQFTEIYEIKFERLDNFLAYLGGLLLAIYVICKLLLGSYNYNRYLLEVAMQQYQIYLEEVKKPREKFNSSKDIQPFLDNSSFMVKFKMLVEDLSKKRVHLAITVGYWLQRLFCRKCFYSESSRLIDRCCQKIEEDLDVNTILDKLNQIEMLKKVLLNDQQIAIFDFTRRKRLTQQNYLEIITDLQKYDLLIGSFQGLLDEDVPQPEKR